jgi:hypothetical protein
MTTIFLLRSERAGIIRPLATAGDAGGDVEGDEAFAGAGVADEERDFADGDFFGPEPFDFLGGTVSGADEREAVVGLADVVVDVKDGLHGGVP